MQIYEYILLDLVDTKITSSILDTSFKEAKVFMTLKTHENMKTQKKCCPPAIRKQPTILNQQTLWLVGDVL